MYICVCQAITDKQLHKLAKKVDGNYNDLQMKHGVGATCGKCEECALEVCGKFTSGKKNVCA